MAMATAMNAGNRSVWAANADLQGWGSPGKIGYEESVDMRISL